MAGLPVRKLSTAMTVAGIEERVAEVGADEAGAAGDEDVHGCWLREREPEPSRSISWLPGEPDPRRSWRRGSGCPRYLTIACITALSKSPCIARPGGGSLWTMKSATICSSGSTQEMGAEGPVPSITPVGAERVRADGVRHHLDVGPNRIPLGAELAGEQVADAISSTEQRFRSRFPVQPPPAKSIWPNRAVVLGHRDPSRRHPRNRPYGKIPLERGN